MEPAVYHFSGALTFTHAAAALESFTQFLQRTPTSGNDGLITDLAQITEVDSSALAVLLASQRLGNQLQKPIDFRNWPKNLASLAQLYGVFELFPTHMETSEAITPVDLVR